MHRIDRIIPQDPESSCAIPLQFIILRLEGACQAVCASGSAAAWLSRGERREMRFAAASRQMSPYYCVGGASDLGKSRRGIKQHALQAKRRRATCPVGGDCAEVSVVICAHAQQRWQQTRAAAQSVLGQHPRPAQVLLVVDHSATLAARASRELPEAAVLDSEDAPGLSGARNAGLRAAKQPATAFPGDDAAARPGRLAALVEPSSSDDVMAAGGSVHPRWPQQRPRRLSPAFDPVVGCGYAGLPEAVGVVRNPIGANMSVRTRMALDAGGFDAGLRRAGTRPVGCEETELAIRLTTSRPGAVVLYDPAAAVDHHVGPERLTFRRRSLQRKDERNRPCRR